MDGREEQIRERAYRLWEDEGRPDGRDEHHWFQATEILAIEENQPTTLKPVEAEEAPEPIEALTNAGEFPTLTDRGEMEIPHRPGPSSDFTPHSDSSEAAAPGQGGSEPVSEIETIERSIETPKVRRVRRAPASARAGEAPRRGNS